jgi:hypothetical protein
VTTWERRIVDIFAEKYPASAAAALASNGDDPHERRPLRLSAVRLFPDFNRAPPDEKESFLEAAESLEARGLLSLVWVRRRKHEELSALICRDPELLFELAEKPSPKVTAEAARQAARTAEAGDAGAFFAFLAEACGPLDAERGVDVRAIEDLACLVQTLSGSFRHTTRALSVSLYRDSKRLEALLPLFAPLLSRAQRQGIRCPDFSFLDRSFPETLIAGKIVLSLDDGPSLVNASGLILGLPLGTILKLRRVSRFKEAGEAPTVLMVENKETFYALGQDAHGYDCVLYVGGHPNRAVRELVLLLAGSGFELHHAGDLDPDGILILQELRGIAGKPVRPVLMDRGTFDHYQDCGRRLEPSMLRRLALIHDTTRAIPGIGELIDRIEETGLGIEQEIIDWKACAVAGRVGT